MTHWNRLDIKIATGGKPNKSTRFLFAFRHPWRTQYHTMHAVAAPRGGGACGHPRTFYMAPSKYHCLDVVFLTGTWLSNNEDVVISELSPPGYSFLNIPWATEAYGGLQVIFRSALKLEILPSNFNIINFEHTLIDKQRKVIFALVYRPPPSSENGLKTSEFLSDFDDFLIYINSFSSKVLLVRWWFQCPRGLKTHLYSHI